VLTKKTREDTQMTSVAERNIKFIIMHCSPACCLYLGKAYLQTISTHD